MEKPNVLVIMADDHGYHDLGFQGSEHIKTPHLDRLASLGMREGSRSFWYNEKKDDKPGNMHAAEHNGKQVKFDGHFTDWLGKKTIEFIDGKKGTKLEGGRRVPFLLYWKGHIPAGRDYDEMISSMDIMPTSLKAAGGSLEQERPLDGVDLMPYITGKKKGVPHQQLYWRKLKCAAMRDGDWKLFRIEGLDLALYNVKNDIGEQNNLAKQMPEKVQRMEKMLVAWEQDKVEPLWSEGKYWEKWRQDYHKAWFETGKPPVKKKQAK